MPSSSRNLADIDLLVNRYRVHALIERGGIFVTRKVDLSRNANHIAAPGMSLHMCHEPLQVVPFV